ncbi:hypothetical protein HDV00_010664 [Rhizophlyctis rosea]|nr:hypothetical protein HDV00_010664 [Rhizophlyctis rosea]
MEFELFIEGIPREVDDKAFKQWCGHDGPVRFCRMATNGAAVVKMKTAEGAAKLLATQRTLNGANLIITRGNTQELDATHTSPPPPETLISIPTDDATTFDSPLPNNNPPTTSAFTSPTDEISSAQKKDLSDMMGTLSEHHMAAVVEIIREGIPQLRDVENEIKFDIDSIEPVTLAKLYDYLPSSPPSSTPPLQRAGSNTLFMSSPLVSYETPPAHIPIHVLYSAFGLAGDVLRAFRKLALRFHPDRVPRSTSKNAKAASARVFQILLAYYHQLLTRLSSSAPSDESKELGTVGTNGKRKSGLAFDDDDEPVGGSVGKELVLFDGRKKRRMSNACDTTTATTTNAFGIGGNASGGGGSSFSFNKLAMTASAFGGFANQPQRGFNGVSGGELVLFNPRTRLRSLVDEETWQDAVPGLSEGGGGSSVGNVPVALGEEERKIGELVRVAVVEIAKVVGRSEHACVEMYLKMFDEPSTATAPPASTPSQRETTTAPTTVQAQTHIINSNNNHITLPPPLLHLSVPIPTNAPITTSSAPAQPATSRSKFHALPNAVMIHLMKFLTWEEGNEFYLLGKSVASRINQSFLDERLVDRKVLGRQLLVGVTKLTPDWTWQLLDRGADPTYNGSAALFHCVRHGYCVPSILSALLSDGADPNAVDGNGVRILDCVVDADCYDGVKELLDWGADRYANGRSAFTNAAQLGDGEILQLLEGYDSEAESEGGEDGGDEDGWGGGDDYDDGDGEGGEEGGSHEVMWMRGVGEGRRKRRGGSRF